MKRKIFIPAVIVCAVSLIVYSQIKTEAFAPAADFPRGALVYVQIEDLPAFIRLWNESELKKNYLESENFEDFSNAHLGRKLASRWREFNEAAGFDFDLETVSAFSQNRAAIALYDAGKLEFVFIAPVSGEIFTATKLFQNKEKFEAETLEDGTEIYRAAVKADRGRQKQDLLFTHTKDRLIVATSEKLLAQTVRNIGGENRKNRLIDEPDFAALKDKTATHAASVWLNQTALNDDYYFRRYWLMSGVEDLKNIRAGIFDFEIQENKFIEHRSFLLDESENIASVDPVSAAKLSGFLPEKIPFYRLQKTDSQAIDKAVRRTVFSRETEKTENFSGRSYWYYSPDDDDDYYCYYGNLGEKYDEAIDDGGENFEMTEDKTKTDFSAVLSPADPSAVLTFGKPEILPAPLFVKFKFAAVFDLNAPQNFNREAFEKAVANEFSKRVTVENSGENLEWKSVSENDLARRELELPMLGFGVNYVLKGNNLILTNDKGFLFEILSARGTEKPESDFAELKVINLAERENAFENVFSRIEEDTQSKSFFTGNIASLLDSLKDVKKIEVRKKYLKKIMEEEVNFYK